MFIANLDAGGRIRLVDEMPSTFSGLIMDHFDPVTVTNIDKILELVKATAYGLESCPSWLLK